MSRIQDSKPTEAGAVLILVALLAVVLVMFLAIAIDWGRLASAHQKQSRTAELAALGALESYLALTPALGTPIDDHLAKLQAAKRRAEEIAGSLDNSLRGAGIGTSQIGTFQLRETSQLPAPPADQIVGEITPGRWWFTEPPVACSAPSPSGCPCAASGIWEGQCFEPNAAIAPVTPAAVPPLTTAFRVRLFSHESNRVPTIFGRVAGLTRSFEIESVAQASLVPRHAVFAIDMSNSVAFETHRPPSNIADFKQDAIPLAQAAYETNAACEESQIIPAFAGYNWSGHPNYPTPPFIQPELEDTRTTAAVESLRKHYKEDYQCRAIDYDLDSTPDAYYFLEQNNIGRTVCLAFDPSGTCVQTDVYRGPEPLNSILSGINEGLQIMEGLAVPGDRVVVVGFDEQIIEARLIGPTPAVGGQPDFDLLKRLTNISDPAYIDERLGRVFFPRNPGFTDISEVLLRAQKILTELPGAEAADSWIALFSDGLATCNHYNGTSLSGANFLSYNPGPPPSTDFILPNKPCSPPSLPPPAAQDGSPPGCSPWVSAAACSAAVNQVMHEKAVAEIRTIATSGPIPSSNPFPPLNVPPGYRTLQESGIAVHTFLLGNYVQPHTLVRKGDSGCMTDEQARIGNVQFTSSTPGEKISNASESTPYRRINSALYEGLSRPTQGYFNPIRRPCDPSAFGLTLAECKAGRLVQDFLAPACTALPAVGNLLSESSDGSMGPQLDAIVEDGRLVCDPLCRTQQEQVHEGISQLFSGNPFVLVERP